jgi:hypothetical protein
MKINLHKPTAFPCRKYQLSQPTQQNCPFLKCCCDSVHKWRHAIREGVRLPWRSVTKRVGGFQKCDVTQSTLTSSLGKRPSSSDLVSQIFSFLKASIPNSFLIQAVYFLWSSLQIKLSSNYFVTTKKFKLNLSSFCFIFFGGGGQLLWRHFIGGGADICDE